MALVRGHREEGGWASAKEGLTGDKARGKREVGKWEGDIGVQEQENFVHGSLRQQAYHVVWTWQGSNGNRHPAMAPATHIQAYQ